MGWLDGFGPKGIVFAVMESIGSSSVGSSPAVEAYMAPRHSASDICDIESCSEEGGWKRGTRRGTIITIGACLAVAAILSQLLR